MTGYFFFASKVTGRTMMPQMSVLPSRAFGDEDLGRPEARRDRRGHVTLLERQRASVAHASQLDDRRQIDARVRVDVVLVIRRPRDVVRAIRLRVRDQTRAVEVDAVVVNEVRVLLRVHAARAEVDLAVGDIDAVHAAHHPLALRDLVLHAARLAIVQVEVVPAIALRRPHQFLARSTTSKRQAPWASRQLAPTSKAKLWPASRYVKKLFVTSSTIGRTRARRRVDLEHAVDL